MYTSTMDTRIQVQWTNKRQQWIHVNIFTSRGLFLWDSLGLSLFPFDPDLGLCRGGPFLMHSYNKRKNQCQRSLEFINLIIT